MARDTRVKRNTGKAARPLAKSAATRRRVLDAAAKVLVDRGYAATRLGDIAEYADLQAGSLYYYFDSKEELVEEVLRYGVQFTHAHVRTAVDQLPEDAAAGTRLRAAVDAHLESMLELGDLAPAHVRTFNQIPPEMQERLRTARRAFGKFWAELVDGAIEAGEVRSDLDPYIIRLFIVNSIERVTEWHLRQRRSAEELAQIMRTMVFEGVGTSGGWAD
ncbi:MAG: TetR/AcrR family transcriptional regulator [Actinobacteria bacterium]|nr:TetR/AcrR family transcriptional regulator [Actinomycetota bacterium]